ncbi:MAG: hypothetical protein R3F55_10560 [Alphaproteobacteria bacterium]
MRQTRKNHNRTAPFLPAAARRDAPRLGAVALLCLALCGCSDIFLPSLTGVDPAGGQTGGLVLGSSSFVPNGVSSGASTGTIVGDRIDQMRDQLEQVQGEVRAENAQLQAVRTDSIQAAARYQTRLAEIRTRLQIGTTPGNPELVGRFNEAQTDLETFGAEVNALTQLSTRLRRRRRAPPTCWRRRGPPRADRRGRRGSPPAGRARGRDQPDRRADRPAADRADRGSGPPDRLSGPRA